MSRFKVLIVSVFAACFPGALPAFGEQEESDPEALLQLYLTELDHSGFMKFMHQLVEMPDEARVAIESRLKALEDGTDQFRNWGSDPDENRRDRATMGAVLHALGALASSLGDEDFAHSVWRRSMILVLDENLGVGAEALIADEFIGCSRPGDRDLVAEIVKRRNEFLPGVIMMAERSLERVTEAPMDRSSNEGGAAESGVETEARSVSDVDSNPWPIAIVALAALTSVVFVVRAVRGRRNP